MALWITPAPVPLSMTLAPSSGVLTEDRHDLVRLLDAVQRGIEALFGLPTAFGQPLR